MEVHHHPHTEKKHFKGYLLEGLMIFIAVTMGFFAESIRENINDKHKEREYVTSLINNLEQDKIFLNYCLRDNQKKIIGLDSLLSLSNKNMTDPHNKQLLYKYSQNYITFYSGFSSNDATMMQLKNSGGLQYIKHDHAADSIAMYDNVVRSIYAAENPYSKAINDAADAMGELLIFRVREDTTYFRNNTYTNKDLPLLNSGPQKIEIFFNKISLERGWTQNYVNNLQEKLPFTIRLIDLLKKEYDYQ
jgi:hypothetical protein